MIEDIDVSLDGRRYSAVVVAHGSLASLDDVCAAVPEVELTHEVPTASKSVVRAYRAEWLVRRNLYPYGSQLRRSTSGGRGGLFAHRCFVAEIRSPKLTQSPVFVFASPHLRVVGSWSEALDAAVDNPRPIYATPRLSPLFEDLASTSAVYKATQITLQLPSNENVETVALTGKSPLISSLRAQLEGKGTLPYAVRLEMPRAPRPLLFHMDRHGNFWWHQMNEAAFGVAASAVASLGGNGYFTTTRILPHRSKRALGSEKNRSNHDSHGN